MGRKLILGIVVLILLIPVISFLSWYFTPKKNFTVAIIDKTVMTSAGQEHISLHWVLNHSRFMKTNEAGYTTDTDYFGFFPREDTLYSIKGLERFSNDQLGALSADADMLYVTDTYGIYKQEWYARYTNKNKGILYGGLSDQDMTLMKFMKAKHKLVIAEFNCLASPTPEQLRNEFESMYHVSFTGWTGRFFNSLDLEVNLELPDWIVATYKNAHNGNWPFKNEGVVFVNQAGTVVILEAGKHLEDAMPYIFSSEEGRKRYNLPEKEKYPFWFEIMEVDTQKNKIYANFKLETTSEGASELETFNIPSTFPAVINHKGNDYDFYYLAGDFSDNPIGFNSSYFKGIGLVKNFFYDKNQRMDRGSFFFNFYKPMITQILDDAYKNAN